LPAAADALCADTGGHFDAIIKTPGMVSTKLGNTVGKYG
jgi:hypothetical protein